MDPNERTLSQIVELRRARAVIADAEASRRIGTVIRQLRRTVGSGVPKRKAAALLDISPQALERWVRCGAIPVTRKPGSSRALIDAEALLAVAAKVTCLRERGETRGVVATALRNLAREERMPRRLCPNQSARELRYEYLHSTPAERLRTAAALAELGVSLAARRGSVGHGAR